MENTRQVRRITYYEGLFDKVSGIVSGLEHAIAAFEAAKPDIAALAACYKGGDWKTDFEADEAGLLPAGFRRGVLSEDGVYDLLEDVRALSEAFVRQDRQSEG